MTAVAGYAVVVFYTRRTTRVGTALGEVVSGRKYPSYLRSAVRPL